jgi:CD2 antigen cytoplasmic tail-binding protein 2
LQDAWLDSVEIDPRFAGLSSAATKDEEEVQELSSKDVAIMKRRIANVLEPEETVRPMFYHSIHS